MLVRLVWPSFLKIIFLFVCICVNLLESVYDMWGLEEWVLDPLGLELQAVMSYYVGAGN